jgi:hypothetical protein
MLWAARMKALAQAVPLFFFLGCGGTAASGNGDGIVLTGRESIVLSTDGAFACGSLQQESIQIDLASGAFDRTRVFNSCGTPSAGNPEHKTATLTAAQLQQLTSAVEGLTPKVTDRCGSCDCSLSIRVKGTARDDSYASNMSHPECDEKKPVVDIDALGQVIKLANSFVP